jgi:hypothetical protein
MYPVKGETMKRIIYPIIILSMLMFACNISTTATPTAVTQPPETLPVSVTETPVVPSETPVVPTVPPVVQTNVTCNEMAVYLDPALASSYSCQIIPESAEGMEILPQYTELTLKGYLLSDKFFTPSISIFPVQRYTELLPDFIPGRLADLNALIGGGAPSDSALPFLPIFNAAQTFHAKYQMFPFANGGGIRFLTLYAQSFAPVNNHDLFYTYQGLTSDGKYWVSAILPINHPILPANADNPPAGQTWEQFGNNYPPYIADMTTQLNSQSAESYTPTFAMLDAFVTSITIQP